MKAIDLLRNGPLPPVNAAARIANEILARLDDPRRSMLMPIAEAAQLVGVGQRSFVLWYAQTFGAAPRYADLVKLWSIHRWATPAQLDCFDLSGVVPKAVGADRPPLYDFIDVLGENGWETQTHLLTTLLKQRCHSATNPRT